MRRGSTGSLGVGPVRHRHGWRFHGCDGVVEARSREQSSMGVVCRFVSASVSVWIMEFVVGSGRAVHFSPSDFSHLHPVFSLLSLKIKSRFVWCMVVVDCMTTVVL